MPKDPSFDFYLDQQIEDHMKDDPLDDYPDEQHDEFCAKEGCAQCEEDEEDEKDEATYSHPTLRKFNPLAIILEEEEV